MTRRVYIGNDNFEDNVLRVEEGLRHGAAAVGATDAEILAQLFGQSSNDTVGNDDEIVGDDDVDIVGAPAVKKKAPAENLLYLQWLPLTPPAGVSFTAGEVKEIELKPQRKFRPGQLVVDPTVKDSFVLTSLSIGQENQFVASGGIPLSVFGPDTFPKLLKSQTAGPGVSIILGIQSIEASAAKVLRGLWIGDSVVR